MVLEELLDVQLDFRRGQTYQPVHRHDNINNAALDFTPLDTDAVKGLG
jgi:hypothetical protein